MIEPQVTDTRVRGIFILNCKFILLECEFLCDQQQDAELFFRFRVFTRDGKNLNLYKYSRTISRAGDREKAILSFHRYREINHARCSFCLNRTNVSSSRAIF